MTVGDELQSIYGFRHADLEVFREQRRAIDGSARAPSRCELSGNFRSRPAVIGAVNALGATLLGDAFRPLRVGAAPLAAPLGEGPAVELLLTAREGWEATGIDLAPAHRRAHARSTASPRPASSPRGCASWPTPGVPRGEMVVLLRAFTHLDAYEDSLERAGLRPYVVGGRGYWSQQQVADVCALLATIANPLDDQALFGALASPACGLAPGHPLAAAGGGGPGTPRLARGGAGDRTGRGRARRARASRRRSPQQSWRCCDASPRRLRGLRERARASPSPA